MANTFLLPGIAPASRLQALWQPPVPHDGTRLRAAFEADGRLRQTVGFLMSGTDPVRILGAPANDPMREQLIDTFCGDDLPTRRGLLRRHLHTAYGDVLVGIDGPAWRDETVRPWMSTFGPRRRPRAPGQVAAVAITTRTLWRLSLHPTARAVTALPEDQSHTVHGLAEVILGALHTIGSEADVADRLLEILDALRTDLATAEARRVELADAQRRDASMLAEQEIQLSRAAERRQWQQDVHAQLRQMAKLKNEGSEITRMLAATMQTPDDALTMLQLSYKHSERTSDNRARQEENERIQRMSHELQLERERTMRFDMMLRQLGGTASADDLVRLSRAAGID